jgi:FkbM family methyltransferase
VNKPLVRLAERLGIASYARPVKRALEPPRVKRFRREHEHLRLLLTFVLGEADNCVDVGASRGEVLAEIVRLAPAGKHFAFEPLPDLHRPLAERFPGVEVRQAAVAAQTGEAEFALDLVRDDMSGLRQQADDHRVQKLQVRTEALDDVLPRDYVPRLIKVDVEGAELEVMRGAQRTIHSHRPIIVFELTWSTTLYGAPPSDIHAFLTDAGLRIFDVFGGGPYSAEQLQDALNRGEPENFVAH